MICKIENIKKLQSKNKYAKLNSINIQYHQKNNGKFGKNKKESGKKVKISQKKDQDSPKANANFMEFQLKKQYDQIMEKYESSNEKIQCAAQILKNKTTIESKNVIENFEEKTLKDDGAIAMGYAIYKNNTLKTVSITPVMDQKQQHRKHWSTCIGYGPHW